MTIKTLTIKKGIAALTIGTTLVSGGAVFAKQNDSQKAERKAKIEALRQEIKQKREEIKDVRKSGSGSTASGSHMRGKGKKTGSGRTVMGKQAIVNNAMITAINGSTLTVSKDSKSMTVMTGSGTVLKRRFGAVAQWSEFAVNQYVDVKGTWADEAKTSINAQWIRNRSIQKRHGTFNGVVTSLTGSGFTLNTMGRGMHGVFPTGATKIVDRKGNMLTLGNILVGHRLRVKGVWDRANRTITEVTHIKDKSLPTGSGSMMDDDS